MTRFITEIQSNPIRDNSIPTRFQLNSNSIPIQFFARHDTCHRHLPHAEETCTERIQNCNWRCECVASWQQAAKVAN